MEDNRVPSKVDLRARAAEQSRIAGKSLGKMLFKNNPGWSDSTLSSFVDCLRPKSPMIISVYKSGVIEGFNEARLNVIRHMKYATGNKLPPQ